VVVDISKCMINLSVTKARVIGEAFRRLSPAGRFAVFDMILLEDNSKLLVELVCSVEL